MKIVYLSYLDREDFAFLSQVLPEAIRCIHHSDVHDRSRLLSSLMALQIYFELMSRELDKSDDEVIECELSIRQALDLQLVVDDFVVSDIDALHLAKLLLSFVVPFESEFLLD